MNQQDTISYMASIFVDCKHFHGKSDEAIHQEYDNATIHVDSETPYTLQITPEIVSAAIAEADVILAI